MNCSPQLFLARIQARDGQLTGLVLLGRVYHGEQSQIRTRKGASVSLWKKLFKSAAPPASDTKAEPNPAETSAPRISTARTTSELREEPLDHPSIEQTKSAAARMRPKIMASQVNIWSFSSGAKSIAKQFSLSRKTSTGTFWWNPNARCLLDFGEWVCLLSQSDFDIEPDKDVYFAGLLAGMVGELSHDFPNPLNVRFLMDLAFSADEERRGHHSLNALQLIAPRLPKIEGLSLDNFRLTSLNPIPAFKDLRALSISGCGGITEFSKLSELASLEVLLMDCTSIRDLTPIVNLPNLRLISLIGCKSVSNESIRALAEAHANGRLQSLREIRLGAAGVTAISDEVLEAGVPTQIFSVALSGLSK